MNRKWTSNEKSSQESNREKESQNNTLALMHLSSPSLHPKQSHTLKRNTHHYRRLFWGLCPALLRTGRHSAQASPVQLAQTLPQLKSSGSLTDFGLGKMSKLFDLIILKRTWCLALVLRGLFNKEGRKNEEKKRHEKNVLSVFFDNSTGEKLETVYVQSVYCERRRGTRGCKRSRDVLAEPLESWEVEKNQGKIVIKGWVDQPSP